MREELHPSGPPEDPAAYQVLRPDGTLRAGAQPTLGDELVVAGLRWMLLSRAFEARAIALQRQGLLGTLAPVMGQEASVVGSAMAFDPRIDWLVPQYRELPAYLIWGFPLTNHILNLRGNPVQARIPDHVKMLPTQISLASQLPHAVGIAWGLKIQKKEGVVVTYFGEGASSEGDFHEACNLAGVTQAPIVFFLQNNQWAISTPRVYQTAAEHLSDRAKGYGFHGRVVDGNDLMAVYEVTKEAVDRARAGGGPTLIESITYRLSFHNTTDDATRYQDQGALEEARKRDPIERVIAYLGVRKLWRDRSAAEFAKAVNQEIDEALELAIAAPPSDKSQIFDNIFSSRTPRQEQQRRDMLTGE